MKRFLTGEEAFAEGVRLARPQVVGACPNAAQAAVAEHLAEMVKEGELPAQLMHAEDDHSALACAMDASAAGTRAFAATSGQGLLGMADVLARAAGKRLPIVMMNANGGSTLPGSAYDGRFDSLALLDHGWIQCYAQDNQEALDMALMAYRLAEDAHVRTPVMVNLDGPTLARTREAVGVPTPEQADAFLPPYAAASALASGRSAGPAHDTRHPYRRHKDMLAALDALDEVERAFEHTCGRTYTGAFEEYRCEDADYVMVTLGSMARLVRQVVDRLREQGMAAGMLRIRYLRPFDARTLALSLAHTRAVGVLEQDVSFGAEGTVFTNVNSALFQQGVRVPTCDFIGGLDGAGITPGQVAGAFKTLTFAAGRAAEHVQFLGIDSMADTFGAQKSR